MAKLPPETISLIFDHACRSTLLNLSLCNRQFYEIAIPKLYKTVDFHCDGLQTAIIGFRPLTCLLLRKPWIARSIQHLSLRSAWEDSRERPVVYEEPREPEPEIRKAIEDTAYSVEEKREWLKDARLPVFEDCIMPLFLAQLTNLQTLDVEIPVSPTYVARQLERVGRKEHPYDHNPTLQNLHSVMSAHPDNKYGLDPENVSWIFRMPSIRQVYLHRIGTFGDTNDEDEWVQLPKGTSTCKLLEMRDCKLSGKHFTNLLQCCEQLETLCYEIGDGYLSSASNDWSAIYDALALHKKTLRDLRLEYLDHHLLKVVPSIDDETSAIQSLREFEALRRVELDTFFLFGFDSDDDEISNDHLVRILPAQIVHIKITHAEEDPEAILSNIEVLLQQKRAKFTELEKVFIRSEADSLDEYRDRLKTLYSQAESVSVQFEVAHTVAPPPSDEEPDDDDTTPEDLGERKWGFDEDVEWRGCSSLCNQRTHYEAYDLSC
ncbi:MAG: hypothetical protein M1821_006253 [Bathelium mastoideum]|nr:MAG: hypothetical protein M1821_006253 [Bathelium mastoideum]KAI9686594.1 MAG: hypothetical protein M1822_003605 [Bathelium mastoideum]